MKARPADAGFTLLEVLVMGAVMAIMLGAYFSFYRSQVLALATQERFLNAKQGAQIGLDFLMRELRTAGSRPAYESFPGCNVAASTATVCHGFFGVKGFPSLVSANATGLRMLADFRGNGTSDPPDGCPNDPGEDITYTYDAGTGRLLRTVGSGTPSAVLEGIAPSGLTLRYFGYGSGNPPAYVEFTGTLTADQIARLTHVVMSVTTRATSRIPNAPPIVSNQTSTIDMRNPAC